MNEAIWALIGLLAASTFGHFYFLSSKIDSLGESLGARLDRLDARIDGVYERLDSMSARLDSISGRLDAHIEAHRG